MGNPKHNFNITGESERFLLCSLHLHLYLKDILCDPTELHSSRILHPPTGGYVVVVKVPGCEVGIDMTPK